MHALAKALKFISPSHLNFPSIKCYENLTLSEAKGLAKSLEILKWKWYNWVKRRET